MDNWTSNFYRSIRNLGELVRWTEWFDSKVPLIFICYYYLFLVENSIGTQALLTFFGGILSTCLFLAFGYYINDISDMEGDKNAGKYKLIHQLPTKIVYGLLIFLGVAGIGLFVFLSKGNPFSLGFIAIAYFFAIFYSIPPIRFKERGIWGLLISATAQRSFLCLYFFSLFNHFSIDTWLFFLLFTFIGIRWILVHQLIDLKSDIRNGVKTFATVQGYIRTSKYLSGIEYPLEIICMFTLWIWISIKIPYIWIIPLGYIVLTGIKWFCFGEGFTSDDLVTYVKPPLADFYFAYWPISFTVFLSLHNSIFWTLFSFNVLWQGRYIYRTVKYFLYAKRNG